MKLSHGKENSSIAPMCEIKRMPTAEQKNNNKNKKIPRPSLKQKQVILSREELSTLFIYISSAFPLWSKKKKKKDIWMFILTWGHYRFITLVDFLSSPVH